MHKLRRILPLLVHNVHRKINIELLRFQKPTICIALWTFNTQWASGMGRLKSYLLFVGKKLVGGWLLLVTSILLCQVHFENQKLNSTKFNDFSLKFMFLFCIFLHTKTTKNKFKCNLPFQSRSMPS
jgi:hypothetical protein